MFVEPTHAPGLIRMLPRPSLTVPLPEVLTIGHCGVE